VSGAETDGGDVTLGDSPTVGATPSVVLGSGADWTASGTVAVTVATGVVTVTSVGTVEPDTVGAGAVGVVIVTVEPGTVDAGAVGVGTVTPATDVVSVIVGSPNAAGRPMVRREAAKNPASARPESASTRRFTRLPPR